MEYVIGGLAVLIGVPMLVAAVTRRPGQAFGERMSEVGDAMSRGGDAMQRMGCALTLAVTVPIAGFIIAGWIGLAIGLLIAFAFAGSAMSKKD